MLTVNGKSCEYRGGQTLKEYLLALGHNTDCIAVECNQEIIPKREYEQYILKDGDVLEIVSYMGGGQF